MSLFESASLCITPNGTKASKLYAIKPTDGSGDLSVTRATTATRVNSSGLIESVSTNVPRLDYSNSTCPSILVEPQRTNLVLRSQEFDNSSWLKDNSGTGVLPVVTANYAIAPDGTNTADRVQFLNIGKTLTTDYSLIVQYPITLGSTGTFTIYLKSNTSSNQNVLCYWGAGEGNVFSVTPQWQRFTLPNLTSGLAGIAIGSRGGFGFTAGGDETLDISVWGAQLEAGSYATSYIPTTSTSVTRNADVISKTGISSLIGQTEGTMFVEYIKTHAADSSGQILAIISNNVDAAATRLQFQLVDNTIRLFTLNGYSSIAISDYITIPNGTNKIAVSYGANGYKFYINGVLAFSNTSTTIPSTQDLTLGSFPFGIAPISDGIKSVVLWKTQLTNTELATLTTI